MEPVERPDPASINAAKIVLIELIEILDDFREFIVLVGGSVPPYLVPHVADEYFGTVDIDIAIDPRALTEVAAVELDRRLAENGFYQHQDTRPFRYFRDVTVEGETIPVVVDILSGEYGGEDVGAEYLDIHGVKALRAKGSNLAFEQSRPEKITGIGADGVEKEINIRIAMLVPFIVMKGMALHDRAKDKDAYDIYFCLKNYKGGIEKVIDEFLEVKHLGRVKDGLEKIAEYFKSPEDTGPRNAAEIQRYDSIEDRDIIRRDAYELVRKLVLELGVMEDWEYDSL